MLEALRNARVFCVVLGRNSPGRVRPSRVHSAALHAPYISAIDDLLVRICVMTHSEQIKTGFPQEAPPRTTDPTSGQGGVAKGVRDVAATCLPVAACGKRPREYFNKVKKSPRSRRRGRGQPPRLTPSVQRTLCDLISRGMSRREAAPCLGIDPQWTREEKELLRGD